MVGAEEAGDDDDQVGRDDGECGNVPVFQDHAFEFQVAGFTSGKGGACVACVGCGGLDEGGKVSAAVELIEGCQPGPPAVGRPKWDAQTYLVLDPQSSLQPQNPTPLCINLSLQVERMLLVRQVPGRHNQRETSPEEDIVCCEKGTVVEDDARETQEGRKQAECACRCGD